MNDSKQPGAQPPETIFLDIPVGPRPVRVPPELIRERYERAMAIEYGFFRRKYPAPLTVWTLGDSLVAIDRATRRTVGHRIVRVIP